MSDVLSTRLRGPRNARPRAWPLHVWLLLTVLAPATPVLAAPPLCFAERTILEASELKDELGRSLGGIRAGQVVTVLAEEGPDRALVAINDGAEVRGYVRSDLLRVFLKRDVEVDEGREWWLKGAPLHPMKQDGNAVEIGWLGSEKDASRPTRRVPCRVLSGHPLTEVVANRCAGAYPEVSPRLPQGRPVHFLQKTAVVLDRIWPLSVSAQSVGLLREEIDRSLVESIEANPFGGEVRIRAWVNRADVVPGPPDRGWGRGGGCCSGWLEVAEGSRGGVLEKAIQLRTSPAAQPFARVQPGARFRVLGKPRDGMREIVFLFPHWDFSDYKMTLHGWAPIADLPPIPPRSEKDMVVGHLAIDGDATFPDFRGFEVSASSSSRDGLASVTTQSDGRFALELTGENRLDARSPDGRLAGAVKRTRAMPGGNDEVTIVLGPASFIEGRVRNRAGAWLPNVEVHAMAEGAREASIRTRTDRSGRFRLAAVSGKYSLAAFEPGIGRHSVDAETSDKNMVLELRRKRVLLGAVPRIGGKCAATGIEISSRPEAPELAEFHRRYPLASDCTFAADEIGRWSNPVHIALVGSPEEVSVTWAPHGEYREDTWDQDLEPLCLGGDCAPDWRRSSVYVSVVDQEDVLLTSPVEVDVASGNERRTCRAVAGTCFVHGLPAAGTATATARWGGKSASAQVELKGEVEDTLLRLR